MGGLLRISSCMRKGPFVLTQTRCQHRCPVAWRGPGIGQSTAAENTSPEKAPVFSPLIAPGESLISPAPDFGVFGEHKGQRHTTATKQRKKHVQHHRSGAVTTDAATWVSNVVVYDRNGMPVSTNHVADFTAWESYLPEQLAKNFSAFREKRGITTPTMAQAAAFPIVISGTDLLMVAPTSSGKTLSYLVAVVRSVMQHMESQPALYMTPEQEATHFQSKLLRCSHCGLDMAKHRLCPERGVVHKAVPDVAAIAANRARSLRYLDSHPKGLILVPNSVLVNQVYGLASELCRDITSVGRLHRVDTPEEERELVRSMRSASIVVGTPAMVAKALEQQWLSLKELQSCVVDEADNIISVSQEGPFRAVLHKLPRSPRAHIQLVSATMPTDARALLKKILHRNHMELVGTASGSGLGGLHGGGNTALVAAPASSSLVTKARGVKLLSPEKLPIAQTAVGNNVAHRIHLVARSDRLQRILSLYSTGVIARHHRLLVFCSSVKSVHSVSDQLAEALLSAKIVVGTLTKNTPGSKQVHVLKQFHKGLLQVLVTNDICCRGVDFQGVDHVVNYHFPQDVLLYAHRAGRTGRVGTHGTVHSLFLPEDARLASYIVQFLSERAQHVPPKLQEYARLTFGQHVVQTAKNAGAMSREQRNRMQATRALLPSRGIHGQYSAPRLGIDRPRRPE